LKKSNGISIERPFGLSGSPPPPSHKPTTPQKTDAYKAWRIAHQQQLAPCAGHAHAHAADVRQEADVFNLTVVEYLPYKRMDFFMA